VLKWEVPSIIYGESMSISRVHKVLDIELPTSEKIILILLADNANDESGECWPSQGYLAKRAGMSRQNVNLVINKLREKGYIKLEHRYREDGGQRANVYTVIPGHVSRLGGVKSDDTESVSKESIQMNSPHIWDVWTGIAGDKAKPILGKAIKDFGEFEVAKAIGVVLLKKPADPVPYFRAVLNGGKKKRGFVA
jgi:biotin operon repressor